MIVSGFEFTAPMVAATVLWSERRQNRKGWADEYNALMQEMGEADAARYSTLWVLASELALIFQDMTPPRRGPEHGND